MNLKEIQTIYRLAKLFSRREIQKLILLFLATLVMGFLEVVGVASIAPFMAVVSNPEMIHTNDYLSLAYQTFNFNSEGAFLIALGGLVLLSMMLSNGYTALMNGWTIYFSNMQGHHLSMRLMQKYLSQPYIFYLDRNTADLLKNILAEVYRCVGGVVLPVIQTGSKIVTTLFIFIFLVFLDPILAVSVVVVLGASYGVVLGLVRHHVNKIGNLSTIAVLERYKLATEALSGIKDLKLSAREAEFLRRFAKPSEGSARYSTQAGLIAALPRYALETVAFGGIVTIVIYLISIGKGGGHIIPLISLYALAGYRLMPALQLIYANVTRIKFNLPALEIIVNDLTDERVVPVLPIRPDSNAEPLPFERELLLKNISFSYPNSDKPVVKELHLSVVPKTTIGLIGVTGSGKTTLIDIILGLLVPESGSILVDDVKITRSNIQAWQQNVGYVPQSIYLTDDTVARNIAFAVRNEEIDLDRVKEAAKLAELHDFVETLPEQYQTEVGERGVRLSGGQRQRIGIARALYHDPKVLVLDEATSALDGITENVIMDAIHNLSRKKTIIMIAHRLTTVKACDVIHIMEKGEISAQGTYAELLANNEHFMKMANA